MNFLSEKYNYCKKLYSVESFCDLRFSVFTRRLLDVEWWTMVDDQDQRTWTIFLYMYLILTSTILKINNENFDWEMKTRFRLSLTIDSVYSLRPWNWILNNSTGSEWVEGVFAAKAETNEAFVFSLALEARHEGRSERRRKENCGPLVFSLALVRVRLHSFHVTRDCPRPSTRRVRSSAVNRVKLILNALFLISLSS